MSKPVYSHEREIIEIFLSTRKFIIYLVTKVCFSQCLGYRTLNINSKKTMLLAYYLKDRYCYHQE